MNTIASGFMFISTLFNVGVLFYCKKLSIFEEEEVIVERKEVEVKEEKMEANGQRDVRRDSIVVKKRENLEVF